MIANVIRVVIVTSLLFLCLCFDFCGDKLALLCDDKA